MKRLRPDRSAFYANAHVPWSKPSWRRFTEADLPGGDGKRALDEVGRKGVEAAGYREVGMDHFALESDGLWQAARHNELHRNFMGYAARHVSPQLGLGVSAISDSWSCFAQNEKVLEKYQERVGKGELPIFRGHVLDGEDLVLRRHVLNLMTKLETSWRRADEHTPFLDGVQGRLAECATDGLVVLGEREVRVTETGRAVLRNICMAFDARLVRKAPQAQLFSKTI